MIVRTWLLILALLVFVAAPALAEQAPLPPAGWTDGYILANGIRIHYWRTGGDKPPLVMAHGSSDDGLCWTNLAKELEADFDLILPDARGHGLSDPPKESDAADAQVEDLAGLIKALNLTKPILMGHSMGAASVMWFAAKYPDIPRAVILEDPGLGVRPGGPGAAGAAGNTAEAREQRRLEILERDNLTLDELVDQCMKGSPTWGLSECQIWAPSKRRHHPDTALRGFSGRPPVNDLLVQITAPTLILKADAPPEVRKQNEETAALLKNGKIVHIDGAGHNVRREQKQRLLDALKPFLASL